MLITTLCIAVAAVSGEPALADVVNTRDYVFVMPQAQNEIKGFRFRRVSDPDADWVEMPEIVLPKKFKKIDRVVAGAWMDDGIATVIRYTDENDRHNFALAVAQARASKRIRWSCGNLKLGEGVSAEDVRVLAVENDVSKDGDTLTVLFVATTPRFGKVYLYHHDCPSIIGVAESSRWLEYRAFLTGADK